MKTTVKPFDAYLMLLQTNSEAERKELIPIILSDPSATLSFLRTNMWNYKQPYKLFVKALNIVLNHDDPNLIVNILKDNDLFSKLSKTGKIKTIQRMVYFYEQGLIYDSLDVLLNHNYTDWEMKNIFNIIRPLFEKDNISTETYMKFCILFKSKISEDDLWKLVYQIVTISDLKNIHYLLDKKTLQLTEQMIDTLEASLVANKLQPKPIAFIGSIRSNKALYKGVFK